MRSTAWKMSVGLTLSLTALAVTSSMTALAEENHAGHAAHAVITTPHGAGADFVDGTGKQIGSALLQQKGRDVRLTLDIKGIEKGWHGIHLHMTGRCTTPDFKDAGGHWNPAAQHHGKPGSDTAHRGDLPMVWANDSNRVKTTITLKNINLSGDDHPLLDADGAAIVIHAGQDDYTTDPAGNSGPRIACGVVR